MAAAKKKPTTTATKKKIVAQSKKKLTPKAKRAITKKKSKKTIPGLGKPNKLVEYALKQITKNPVGHPTKYTPELIPIILNLCSKGLSIENSCLVVGLTKTTLYDWIKPDSKRFKPDFSNAVKRGKELSELWWMEKGRDNIGNKNFNSTLYMMQMQNRFGWSRKLEGKLVTEHTEKHVLEVKLESSTDHRAEVLSILEKAGAITPEA